MKRYLSEITDVPLKKEKKLAQTDANGWITVKRKSN